MRNGAPIRRSAELSPSTRRPLAVIAVLGYPAALVTQALLARLGVAEPGPTAAYAVLVASAVGAIWIVFRFQRARGLSDTSVDGLDERQSLVRGRAVARSYWIVSTVLLTLLLIAGLITLTRSPVTISLDLSMVLGLLPGALIFLAFLPSAVIAWVEPDPPAES